MERTVKLIKDTTFFFSKSPAYIKGTKTNPVQWVKAYSTFMKLSWKDNI